MFIVHFNIDKLQARRNELGLSSRAVSRLITKGRSNDTFRCLVDHSGDCCSLPTSAMLVKFYGGLDCIDYTRESTMNTLKAFLEHNGDILACEESPEASSLEATSKRKERE